VNIRIRFYLAIMVLFIAQSLFAQKEVFSPYYQIKRKYENRTENDTTALPLVTAYIRLAKEVGDYPRLVEGYQDAIFYSLNDRKLKYADSAVYAAQLSRDENLMCRAHVSKGTVYYFNFKKYKLALNEFLKAYEYAKKGDDQYYLNKVAYRLAVVKSYIGYYQEALVLFKQTKEFFKKESEKKTHVNLQYGNKRGYYNSLHQMSICYRNLGQQKKADSVTEIGLSLTALNEDFRQEYGYFLKERGISEFYKHQYLKSISTLKSSRACIANVNDFAWMAVCYSYIGKSYMALGDMKQAFPYFQKVDSVFKRNHFVLPELRSNYEELIFHYQRERNSLKELYYTRQLLRADSIIREDFPYLAAKIFKEYDERKLLDQKAKLETKISRSYLLNFTLLAVAGLLALALYGKYKEKQKIREQYKVLEQKILSPSKNAIGERETEPVNTNAKLDIDKKTVDEVLRKLKLFEEKAGFTEAGLTLHKLASKLDTNHTYLSSIIREYRGVNFPRYLAERRIGYITDKLYNDKTYLNYTFETLAVECGMGSRNTFAALFLEINGIRATDFIRERLRKLDKYERDSDMNDN
jgi:AraC-like DNA-binding protein